MSLSMTTFDNPCPMTVAQGVVLGTGVGHDDTGENPGIALLLGLLAPDGTIARRLPPMVIDRENAEALLKMLRGSLDYLDGKPARVPEHPIVESDFPYAEEAGGTK